jgi:hypothetical protein
LRGTRATASTDPLCWGPAVPQQGCYDQLLAISDLWSGHVGLYDLNEPFAPLCQVRCARRSPAPHTRRNVCALSHRVSGVVQTHLNHGSPLLRWSEHLSSFYGSTDEGALFYIPMDEAALQAVAAKGELHADRLHLNSEMDVPGFHFAHGTKLMAYCGGSGEVPRRRRWLRRCVHVRGNTWGGAVGRRSQVVIVVNADQTVRCVHCRPQCTGSISST